MPRSNKASTKADLAISIDIFKSDLDKAVRTIMIRMEQVRQDLVGRLDFMAERLDEIAEHIAETQQSVERTLDSVERLSSRMNPKS
jgi:uncharacterized coiled-coil protein SlyX